MNTWCIAIYRYILRCWSSPGWPASSPSARWTAPPRSRPAQLRSLNFVRACLELSGFVWIRLDLSGFVWICLGLSRWLPYPVVFFHFAVCTYLSAVFHNKSIVSNMKETQQGNLLGFVWPVIVWVRNRASTRSKPPWRSSWPNVGWRGRMAKRLRTIHELASAQNFSDLLAYQLSSYGGAQLTIQSSPYRPL